MSHITAYMRYAVNNWRTLTKRYLPAHMNYQPAERRRLCCCLCTFVYLFLVCLLATFRKNTWTSLHEIYRIGRTWYKEQSELLGIFCLTPCMQIIISGYFFGVGGWVGESMGSTNIRENGWMYFHESFRTGRKWDNEQTVIFWGCCV